jgi:prepilin-type N-terminal cleavage/methylation domain-containing protein
MAQNLYIIIGKSCMNHWQEIKSMRKNSGFTLIELVIVIVVLVILAAVSVPIFLSWLPEYRLRSAADDLYAHLQHAKMQAIRNNNNWAVQFVESSSSYTIYSNYIDSSDTGTAVKTINLSDHGSGVGYGRGDATSSIGTYDADGITYSNNWVVFNKRSMVNNLGYVYLSNNAGSARAVGTPAFAGVVRLRRWAGGSNWP